MDRYDEEEEENFDDIDRDEDESGVEELEVDENGHVIEGCRRRKRHSREDEYEESFGFEEHPFDYEDE